MKILGYDPGAANQGFAVLDFDRETNTVSLLYQGTLELPKKDIQTRVHSTYDFVKQIMIKFPDLEILAVEKLVMNGGIGQAINQVTGVVYLACFNLHLNLYPARAIKKAVTGCGDASKHGLEHSVKTMLKLDKEFKFDSNHSSDATGIALAYLIKEQNYGSSNSSNND